MKNKKSLLIFGIFALVLVLGVGYAVVNEVGLDIGGSATAEETELKVSFKSVEIQKPDTVTVTNSLKDGDKEDEFSITGLKLNDTVQLTYIVQNKETDVAATLEERIALSNSNPNYFEVTYKIEDSSIPVGETTKVVVTVKLTKTPVVEANNSTTISVGLQAEPVNNAPSN